MTGTGAVEGPRLLLQRRGLQAALHGLQPRQQGEAEGPAPPPAAVADGAAGGVDLGYLHLHTGQKRGAAVGRLLLGGLFKLKLTNGPCVLMQLWLSQCEQAEGSPPPEAEGPAGGGRGPAEGSEALWSRGAGRMGPAEWTLEAARSPAWQQEGNRGPPARSPRGRGQEGHSC